LRRGIGSRIGRYLLIVNIVRAAAYLVARYARQLVGRVRLLRLHLSDNGDREAPGALDRFAVLARVLHLPRVELVDVLGVLPRPY
jgi:pyrroloquinoline quinone (PQQ) biosynthesis protein C